jgi:hypothetical protein
MHKASPARYIALALVPLIVADGQTSLSPPAACALSGQAGEAFDPTQVEFVSNPKPASLGDQKRGFTLDFVARIVSLRPLIVEMLDFSGDQAVQAHSCQITRILSADARMRPVLERLRFNDVVKGEFVLSESGLAKFLLTNLQKVQGAPAYFHEREKANCDDRTGTLIEYQTPRERLVLYNDLTISYRDSRDFTGKVWDRQKLETEALNRLMQSFGDVKFNAFPSRKFTEERANESAITLVCARYQKVMLDGPEAVLAPVLRSLNDMRGVALANTSLVLSYKEKREIAFLDWPLPELPPDQVGTPSFNSRAFEQRLPQDFLDKIPVVPPLSPQSNNEVYVKSGSRIFQLIRDRYVAPARAGTVSEIRLQEVLPLENGLIKSPAPEIEPPCASTVTSAGLLWPSGTDVELQRIPPTGQPVSVEEYAAHQPFYGKVFDACSMAGFDFIEGGYLYNRCI